MDPQGPGEVKNVRKGKYYFTLSVADRKLIQPKQKNVRKGKYYFTLSVADRKLIQPEPKAKSGLDSTSREQTIDYSHFFNGESV
jgi:hypothetical protein